MLFCLLKKSLQDKPFETFFLTKNKKKSVSQSKKLIKGTGSEILFLLSTI